MELLCFEPELESVELDPFPEPAPVLELDPPWELAPL